MCCAPTFLQSLDAATGGMFSRLAGVAVVGGGVWAVWIHPALNPPLDPTTVAASNAATTATPIAERITQASTATQSGSAAMGGVLNPGIDLVLWGPLTVALVVSVAFLVWGFAGRAQLNQQQQPQRRALPAAPARAMVTAPTVTAARRVELEQGDHGVIEATVLTIGTRQPEQVTNR